MLFLFYRQCFTYLSLSHQKQDNKQGFTHVDSGTNRLMSLAHDIHGLYLMTTVALKLGPLTLICLRLSTKCGTRDSCGNFSKVEQTVRQLLEFFKSCLSDRRQRVLLNEYCPDWASILSGVLQGSVLCPVLYLVYMQSTQSTMQKMGLNHR